VRSTDCHLTLRSTIRSLLSVVSILSVSACGSSAQSARVILPPGASFGAVTDSLKAHGVITNPRWFKLMARLRGVDRSVHAGVYEFPAGTSPWTVLGMLAHGKKAALRFTVPEGLTILDVAELAATRLGIPADSFVTAARDGKTASALLGIPVSSFEGFLRPETYILPADINAPEVIRLMAEGFKSEWKPEWDARLDSLKMSRLALVTLASIVEGEARRMRNARSSPAYIETGSASGWRYRPIPRCSMPSCSSVAGVSRASSRRTIRSSRPTTPI